MTAVPATRARRRRSVVLAEYGEGDVDLSADEERALRHLAGNRLTLLPTDASGRWRVKASSFVGTVVTPDVAVLVRPKVPTANLFHLLEAGGRSLELGTQSFDYATDSDLIPTFATFYANHLEAALARGVPRSYWQEEERLRTIRGRVNLSAQRRLGGLSLPIECSFDEYSADGQLTRILRGATRRLLQLPGVTVATRQMLRRLDGQLAEAGSLRPADLAMPTRFTRLTEHCRGTEALARIVLQDANLLDNTGTAGAAVFMLDMNKVFEAFVEARLTRYLAGRLLVRPQVRLSLDVGRSVPVRPDLVFDHRHREPVYVADTKYKVTFDGIGIQADYYQLLSYTVALRLSEGLLIYCQRDGEVPPREIEVRHLGTRLRTWAVRLDRSPAAIESELRALASHIFDRACVATAQRA